MSLDLESPTPAYRQIANDLRRHLVEERLKPGDLLPPIRQLALDLGVHFNTVALAYRMLADEGWLELKRRRGATVIARNAPRAVDRRQVDQPAAAAGTDRRRTAQRRHELTTDLVGAASPRARSTTMTSASWSMMLVVTVNAILFHAMPRFSRPDILFAVTVPEAFAAGAGRTLVSRYRAIVWSGAAAALAIGLLLPAPQPGSGRGGMLMMAVVAGNMIVALAAWLLAHRKARAHAVPPSDVRVASLVPRDTSLPGGTLFAVGPFAILLATALLVYTYRDDVPDGPGTIKPFGPLAFGGVYVAMMLTMAVSLARRSRQIAVDGLAAAAEQRFRRVNVLVLVLVAYGAAIQLSATTVESIPAFGDTLSGRPGFVLLPLMLFNFGVAFWMFRVGQGGQRAVAPARGGRFTETPHPTTRGKSAACLFQPARPGHLGRESCRPWLHA